MTEPRRLAVLGVGQIGGSFSLALRRAGLVDEVVGYGRSAASLARAQERKLIDCATTDVAEAVRGARWVLLAAPLRATAALAAAMAPHLELGTVVFDVGSVKGPVVAELERLLPAGAAFVGCHPIAGTERFGPDAADGALFRGRRCILTPTPRTQPEALAEMQRLWEAAGADVVTMEPEHHDAVMAAVSHLPHVAAYGLVASLAGLPAPVLATAADYRTTSLRDTSRIAASSPEMWRDIFVDNRAELLPLVRELRREMGWLEQALEAQDSEAVLAWLARGRAMRLRLIGDT
jgi:prephenate dehydrogenase